MNKKVLIISFDFPPRRGIGGNRIFGLVKYLPRYGWDPIVLTGKLPKKHEAPCKVIESCFSDKIGIIKSIFGYNHETSIYEENNILKLVGKKKSSFIIRLINLIKWLLLFPDRYSSWYKFAVKDIDQLIKENQIHGIISSLNPIISHKIAKYVKSKTDLFWIADYRDLWSTNHYLEAFPIQRKLMYKYERYIVKNADYLVTVSEPLAQNLHKLHNKPVEAIPTGYDPEDTFESTLSESFEIVYTGQLLKGKRDPTLLFKAVNEAIMEGSITQSNLSILFYGQFSTWLDDLIKKFNFSDCVFQMGYVDKAIAKMKQHEAQLLLLLNWDHESDIGNYTGKIFEYISAKRPIISIGREDSVVSNLINEAEIGIASNDYLKIKSFLKDAYSEFKRNRGVVYHGNAKILNDYSQIKMSNRFAYLLSKSTPKI